MRIISRLQDIKTWSEIMGIQSYVFEALDREAKAARKVQVEFEDWKLSPRNKIPLRAPQGARAKCKKESKSYKPQATSFKQRLTMSLG